MYKIPEKVLDAYNIGAIKNIEKNTSGLINHTFKVSSEKGDFIFQRLHDLFVNHRSAEDFEFVLSLLEKKGFRSPRLVKNERQETITKFEDSFWRVQTFILGNTFDTIQSQKMAEEAGKIFAEFHSVMEGASHKFNPEIRLHETKKIFDDFVSILETADPDLKKCVQTEIDFIKLNLPKHFLPDDLPQRTIHGDPKISNILFDKNENAVGLIDLDTCNTHTVLVDLGDAFRSWCGGEEDNPKNKFDVSIFEASWKSYKKNAPFLSEQEIGLVPDATACIILELASRFLKDYFKDSYFAYDSSKYKTRREHNLARTRGQISEYIDMIRQISLIHDKL